MDWIDDYLQAEAYVGFQTHWLMFAIGQLGAFLEVVRENPERIDELNAMLNQFSNDIGDFQASAANLVSVARSLEANARQVIGKIE